VFSAHNVKESNFHNDFPKMSDKSSQQIVEPDFVEAVKTQFLFKLRAQYGIFSTMIIVQLVAILFSFGESSVGSGMNNIHIHSTGYAGNILLFLTFAWAGMMGFRLTLKQSKDVMYTFVTDRKTNHLANVLMIATLSIVGGVSAYLISFIFKITMYLWRGTDTLLFIEKPAVSFLLIGMVGTILYMMLVASLAYFIGEIIQFHKVFVIIVPVFILGMLIVSVNYGYMEWYSNILPYYIFEKNFIMFIVKTLSTSVIALFLAALIGQRLEVRRS